jgi:hypothetical protein
LFDFWNPVNKYEPRQHLNSRIDHIHIRPSVCPLQVRTKLIWIF